MIKVQSEQVKGKGNFIDYISYTIISNIVLFYRKEKKIFDPSELEETPQHFIKRQKNNIDFRNYDIVNLGGEEVMDPR